MTNVLKNKVLSNKLYFWIMIILLLAGWQLGQGIYIQAKAILAQILLEHAWAETRNGKQHVTPWPWADTWPVARLTVPRLNVDLIILSGDTGRTLAFGPGHNFASQLPGKDGNSIISGHRDTHFRFLQYLKSGDNILIEPVQGQQKIYVVSEKYIVDAQQGYFPVIENQSSINLITCYPFNAINPGARQRFIVAAQEAEPIKITNL